MSAAPFRRGYTSPGSGSTGDLQHYQPGSSAYSYRLVSVQAGSFEARPGNKLTIEARVLQEAGDLNTLTPHLRVEAYNRYWEDWIIFNQAAIHFFVLVLAVCLVIVAVQFALSRRRDAITLKL